MRMRNVGKLCLLAFALALVSFPQTRHAIRVTVDEITELVPEVSETDLHIKVQDQPLIDAPLIIDDVPATAPLAMKHEQAGSMLEGQQEICQTFVAKERERRSKLAKAKRGRRGPRRMGRYNGRLSPSKKMKERRAKWKLCTSLAQVSSGSKDTPLPRSKADEDNPWQMTLWDKLCLEAGWLVQFVALLLAIFLFCEFAEKIRGPPPSKAPDVGDREGPEVLPPPPPTMFALYELLWGKTAVSYAINAGLLLLSVVNFFFYSWATEMVFPDIEEDWKFMGLDWDALYINRVLESVSLLIFLPVTIVRIGTIECHPDWRHHGRGAPWRYAVTDIYTILEIIALANPIMDMPQYLLTGKHDHLNLFFLFFARSFEMPFNSVGVRRLKHMVTDDGKLLCTAFVFGLVVWLVLSGLYYAASRESENDGAVWEVAEYNGEPWKKFESIPSLMWFVLINLLKEHPLADAFVTFWERLWVCVCCIFAMPLFAVPASILQNTLFESEKKDNEEAEALGDAPQEEPVALPPLEEDDPIEPPPNFWAGAATFVLIVSSSFVYMYYTAKDTEHAYFCTFPVQVSENMWAITDFTISVIFGLEWSYRIAMQGPGYGRSALGFIDLISWAPGIIHLLAAYGMSSLASQWWSAASMLRVLKLERYLMSWRDIIDIIYENKAVLTATLLSSMLLWMFCSVLIYFTELSNPDPEMRDVFGSIMRSLWAQIINLHGEWPWADYTTTGKGLGTFIGVFSIMFFCIPISIFSEAYKEKVSEEVDAFPEEFDRRPWQQPCRPTEEGLRRRVYDLFYAHLHVLDEGSETGFLVLRGVSFFFVAVTTFISVCGTVKDEDFIKYFNVDGTFVYSVDAVATAFFVFEYIARLIAIGWQHPCSMIGLCDTLSLVGFFVSLNPAWRHDAFHPSYDKRDVLHLGDDVVVLLRLLRMFSLESYLAALHVLKNVFYLYRWPLMRAGYSLGSTWFLHATLLYMFEKSVAAEHGTEHDNAGEDLPGGDDEEDGATMTWRYRSVLSALQYSVVHLFGDYPETDYYLESKIVHFFGIMGGIAIIATFCGVFSGCITNYLEEDRRDAMKHTKMRRFFVFMNCVRSFQRAYRRQKARRLQGIEAPPAIELPAWKKTAMNIAYEKTPQGQGIMVFFNSVLVLAILNSLVSSLPEANRNHAVETGCLVVQAFTTLVFIAEYYIRIAACPKLACSAARWLDAVCIIPGPMKIYVALRYGLDGAPHMEAVVEALSMIRAVRILEFVYFRREVTLICRAFRDASKQLVIPGYLALDVWIVTSALFMWCENYYQDEPFNEAENMQSVPDAMYWCCIFLTGEWANVDFTYAGSRLCIFYVVFGISMFSIPVGILVEAVQSNVQIASEEQKQMNMLMEAASRDQMPSAAVMADFTEKKKRKTTVLQLPMAGGRQSVSVQRSSRASLAARASIAGSFPLSEGGSFRPSLRGSVVEDADAARPVRPSVVAPPILESNEPPPESNAPAQDSF